MTVPADEVARLRVPPQSIEAEQNILGGLLLESTALPKVTELIGPADFYRHQHRIIFEALTTMIAAGEPVDSVTLFDRLRSAGQEDEVGGLSYINSLQTSVASAANIARYAEIVLERSQMRTLIASVDEICTRAFKHEPIDDLIDRAKQVFGMLEQQRGPNRRRLPLLGMEELREAHKASAWLVKYIIPAESIGMEYGGSGTFKSFIALDCALHIAHGLPWMGRKTKQGAVIFIAAEGGAGMWKRIVAWHRGRNLRWNGIQFYVVPCAVNLGVDSWRVVEAAQAIGITPLMVVVDTLSQTYAGEENSANEMAAYLRELGARFRDLWRCTVLLIHHSGHSATDRPRGSSAIRANLDFMLGVYRDEKEMLATLTCEKQKDEDAFADATFQLIKHVLGRDQDGDEIRSLVARHVSGTEALIEAMEAEVSAGRGGNNHLLMSFVQNGMLETDLRDIFTKNCSADTPDGRRKAFYRAKTWACNQGLIEITQGTVIVLKEKTQ